MNRSWSNWMYRLFKNSSAKKTQKAAHRSPRLRMEHLEDRVVPAQYSFNATANTLTINLDQNESLAVTENGTDTFFTINAGNFTSVGPDTATANGTQQIQIADTDIATSLTIDDALATGPSTNNVSFDTGTVTSATITVNIAKTGADTIAFNGGVLSSSGTVTLTDSSGNITSPGATATDVTANTLNMTASTGIGVAAPITTSVSNLSATTATGGVNVSNTGGPLNVTGASATTSGNVSIVTNGSAAAGVGNLTISGAVSAAGGNVLLQNIDNDDVVTLNVNNTVTASGTVMILGEDTVNVTAAVSGGGTVTITADANNDSGTDLTTSGGGTVTSSGGSVVLAASNNVSIGANVSITGGSGSLNITGDSDGGGAGSVTTTATGNVSSASSGDINITGQGVTIGVAGSGTVMTTAGGEIFITSLGAANDVVINAAVSTVNGDSDSDVELRSDDDVRVNAPISASGTDGDIRITANTDLDANGDVITVAPGTLTATDAININGNNITLGAALMAGGAITVDADTDNDGTGDITTTAAITAGASIEIGGPSGGPFAENITLGGPVTVNGNGNITVQGTGTVVNNAAVGVTGTGNISIVTDGSAAAGIANLTIAGPVSAASGNVLLQNIDNDNIVTLAVNSSVTASGTVQILGEDTVNVTAAVSGGGTVTITADANNDAESNLTTSGGGTVTSSGGSVVLAAAGNVSIGANVSITGGSGSLNITADSPSNGTGSVTTTATGNVSSASSGDINITGQGVTIGVAGSGTVMTTAGGEIFITSLGAANDVVINAAVSTVNGDSDSDVELRSADDVRVNAPITTSGTDGDIRITANSDAVGDGFFVTTTGGGASTTGTLTATDQINILGNDADLNAALTTPRTVTIAPIIANSPINLGTEGATAQDFGLSLTDLGQITANTLRVGDAASGDITTTATVTLTTVNTLTLTTGGKIIDGFNGTDIIVTNLSMRAVTGIGTGNAINTMVTNLSASNTGVGVTGDININQDSGALTIAQNIDGLSGLNNAAVNGDVLVNDSNGALTVDANVLAGTGVAGGDADIVLSTNGANAGITKTANGVIQTQFTTGTGDITLDTRNATNAPITLVDGGLDILAVGTGSIFILSNDGISVGDQVDIEATTGGNVTIDANETNATGTGSITFGAGSAVRAEGNVIVDATTGAAMSGGPITMDATATIGGSTTPAALNVTMTGDGSVTVSSVDADVNITVLSTAGNIQDDGTVANGDTTDLAANTIMLTAFGRIGGTNALSTTDIAGATTNARFVEAVDYQLTGVLATQSLDVNQTGAGNVQVRQTANTLLTSDVDVNGTVIGASNQLAIISSGGTLTVDNNALFSKPNSSLLLGTTGGNDIQFLGVTASINNTSSNATTILAATGNANADILGQDNSMPDVTGDRLNLFTTGGRIGGAVLGTDFEFNANRLDGATGGGSAIMTDTDNGLAVGQFNAGAGNVTLFSNGNTNLSPNTNLTALIPNDGIAEIIGNVVTLDTFAAPQITGPTAGQIGLPGTFFEVNAVTLNARTNNSNVWISDVRSGAQTLLGSGAAVLPTGGMGGIQVGTATAFLRLGSGATLGSGTIDNVADVVAATLNLSAPTGTPTAPGGFGTSTTAPLEFDAALLVANLTAGGNVFVRDTSAGLTVQQATTTAGDIGIQLLLGNMVLGNGSGPASTVSATGTATLNATAGSITGIGTTDVTAGSLAATALNGIGASGDNLVTAVGSLAAATTNTGVFINNTNATLDITTVNGVSGINATNGPILVTTSGGLAVTNNVTGTADIDLTATNGAFTTAGGISTNGGAIDLASTAGSMTVGGLVSALNDLTATAGTSFTSSVAGTLTSTARSVSVDAGSTLTLGGAISATNATNGSVDLTSIGALSTSATVTAGTTVTANSGTGTMSIGAALQGGGAVLLTSGDDLSTTGTGTVTSTGSTVNANSTGGALSVGAAIAGNSGVTLNAGGGNLTTTADVSSTAGSIGATAAGAAQLSSNLAAGTSVTVTATDANSAGQDITLAAGKTVSSTGGGAIQLLAGDNVAVNGSVTTAGAITITGDNGNADTVPGTTIILAGTGANTVNGGTVAVNGGLGADVITVGSQTAVSGTTVTLTGNGGADAFNAKPQTNGTQLRVVGGPPSTIPGDSLVVTSDTGTTVVFADNAIDVDTAGSPGEGTMSFTNGGSVLFNTIENLTSVTPFALNLNLATLGFQDGASDAVNVSTTPGVNPVLNVTVNGTSVYSGLVSNLTTLTIDGSNDSESFLIDETNPGIPAGTYNGNGNTTGGGDMLVVNTTNAGNVTFTPGGPGAGTFTFSAAGRNAVNFTGIETVSTNIVSVSATDATASERGADQTPDTATFTFTRTGDVTNALTVNFQISGTALNGRDYQGITGQVTFAAGSATATVTINALNNSLIDGTRTVTLTIVNGVGYSFPAGASATATIADNDSVDRKLAVGQAVGGLVTTINPANGAAATFSPFPGYTGALNTAVGDVNGDGIPDLVIATGFGGPSFVQVRDGATGAVRLVIPILGGGYLGGISVAVGDVDGDGRGEIIVGLQTGLPAVGVFDGMTGSLRVAFLAYSVPTAQGPQPSVSIGVNVAAGDLDGDGKAEIVVTPRGIAPAISIFDGNGNLKNQFLAFSPALGAVGLTVGVGDLDGDGKAEIITGAFLPAGNPVQGTFLLTFNGNGTLRQTRPLPTLTSPGSEFGPSVGAADFNGDGAEDVLVGVGPFLGVLDGKTLGLLSATVPFPGSNGVVVS